MAEQTGRKTVRQKRKTERWIYQQTDGLIDRCSRDGASSQHHGWMNSRIPCRLHPQAAAYLSIHLLKLRSCVASQPYWSIQSLSQRHPLCWAKQLAVVGKGDAFLLGPDASPTIFTALAEAFSSIKMTLNICNYILYIDLGHFAL